MYSFIKCEIIITFITFSLDFNLILHFKLFFIKSQVLYIRDNIFN